MDRKPDLSMKKKRLDTSVHLLPLTHKPKNDSEKVARERKLTVSRECSRKEEIAKTNKRKQRA